MASNIIGSPFLLCDLLRTGIDIFSTLRGNALSSSSKRLTWFSRLVTLGSKDCILFDSDHYSLFLSRESATHPVAIKNIKPQRITAKYFSCLAPSLALLHPPADFEINFSCTISKNPSWVIIPFSSPQDQNNHIHAFPLPFFSNPSQYLSKALLKISEALRPVFLQIKPNLLNWKSVR